MSQENIYETINAQLAAAKTPGDIEQVLSQLSVDQKMQYLYEQTIDQHFNEVKRESIRLIDWMEANGYVNDYARGVSKRAPLMAMLQTSALLLQQSCQRHCRQEMQAVSKETEVAMRLADDMDDYVTAICNDVSQLLTLDCHYHAILAGRRRGVHYVSTDGAFVPYSNDEQRAVLREYQRQADEYDAWLKAETEKDPRVSEGQEVKQLELQLQE